MGRETCVFYASWFDAIETMPEAAQSEAYRAVLSYALRGEETAKQGAMTKLIMAMVRPVIDSNNKRYENGCKGGEYGILGGRPRKGENPKETPKKPQENPKKTPHHELGVSDNVNVNVNVNENESVCDKSHNNAPTPTHAHEKSFKAFLVWCEAVAPLALEFKEPLSIDDFAWLYNTYGGAKIKQCAADLHNKEAHKSNRRAITAWKKFIVKLS